MGRYFDYETAARAAGLSAGDLAALRCKVEGQYAGRMLREMHLLDLCMGIGKGRLTVAAALQPPAGELPPPSEIRMGG